MIKTIIPNWQEVYGKREAWVQIDVCCRENNLCIIKPISFKFIDGKTHIKAEFRVRIVNPLKKDYVALDMSIRFTAKYEFELHQDFFLILNILKSEIEVLEYKSNFNSKLTAKSMTSKLNSLLDAGVEIANKLFKNGRTIPKVPDLVMDMFKKTRMFTYDRYFLLEIDPKIKQPFKDKV